LKCNKKTVLVCIVPICLPQINTEAKVGGTVYGTSHPLKAVARDLIRPMDRLRAGLKYNKDGRQETIDNVPGSSSANPKGPAEGLHFGVAPQPVKN